MPRLFVMLLPALLFAAGNLTPVTVLQQDGAAPTGAALMTIPPASGGAPFKVDIGIVDTIGGTTYDWWANGPIWRQIKNSSAYGVHAVWMNSADMSNTTFPDRNMRYNFYDYATRAWNWVDPDWMQSGVNVFAHRAGYGNVDAQSTGEAIVGSHYTGSGGITPKVARDAAPGAGIFEYADGEPVLGVTQWPPISVGQDGAIHIFPCTAGYELSYSHIAAGNWPTFAAPITGITPSPGFPTHDVAASKQSGKVALVWEISTDIPQDAYMQTSTDYGASWTSATQFMPPDAYGGDTVSSFHISSLFPYYDNNDRLNIVANIMPYVRDTGYIIPSQIWHYCPDNAPQWNRIHVAGCAPANLQAAVGYNATYACRPSMGQDDDGHLFVAWEQFDSANVEPTTSRLRADIFVAGSGDNGLTWMPAVKLTSAGTHSMRFPSIVDLAAEGDPDTCFIIYVADQTAGMFVMAEGPATNNPVLVHRVAVSDLVGLAENGRGVTPARAELTATPNPFTGRTGLSYALPRAGRAVLEIFDLSGRSVARPVDGFKPAGRYSATLQAEGLAPGIYVARLTSGGYCATSKLVLTD